jgi:hypothetical protein
MSHEQFLPWIEEVTRGRVTRCERIFYGQSRGTWLVDVTREDGDCLALVLRQDTGDGPLSGTELTLAREAVVYKALRNTEVRIPKLLESTVSGDALLVERAQGTEQFGAVTDEALR